MQTAFNLITRELVPESRRVTVTGKYFGIRWPLTLEPKIFDACQRIAPKYNGGYWDFYTLSNGGFYMAPSGEHIYRVTCDNMYEGDLSADALGITACLYAYSHLSFSDGRFARVCAAHFYHLRSYAMEHPEATSIASAID